MIRTFESVRFRGRYLIIDQEKNRIRLGTPQNGNERFVVEPSGSSNSGFHVLRAANTINCFMAFGEDGESIAPCSASNTRLETRLFLEVV